MKKTVLRYGLISAAVAVVVMLFTVNFLDRVGYGTTDVVGYSAMVVSALLVYFGVRAYRQQEGAGRLSFGRGLAVGLMITAVSALCQVVAFQVVYFGVAPDFGERFAACMVERARDGGASDAEIVKTAQRARELKRLYDTPLGNAALTFAQPLPIGLVAAAISAALLRKK
ncbi:MAG TPA: DUF4199 domain-containing protein [Thermoanaerobaculia bacterium]|nr:DUF4199 domain-containing protein [Thermoanaerobaculia bacterium]